MGIRSVEEMNKDAYDGAVAQLQQTQSQLVDCASMVGDIVNTVRIWVINRDWEPNTCRVCKMVIDYEADKEGHDEWCLMFQVLAAAKK